MKFLKYITASFLLVVGLSSCEMGGESGTVGTTTVQFANAVVEDGFGAGVVYIPLTITADTEEAMNTCSVQAKVKVVTTGEQYEGAADTDGLSGDYRITSLDVNFPAYDNYYDEKNPQKYYNEETRKWTKEVRMEAFIINEDLDELRFTLEIESVSEGVTLGENKQCKVVLVKTTRDRLCGLYDVSYKEAYWINDPADRYFAGTSYESYFPADASKYTWTGIQIIWEPTYSCFIIASDHFLTQLFGAYFYGYYDETTERMYLYNHEPIGFWDKDAGHCMFHSLWNSTTESWVEDKVVYLTFDVEAGTLSLPEEYALGIEMFQSDESFSVGAYVGEIIPAYEGLVFTK